MKPLPPVGPIALRAIEDAEANVGVHEVGVNAGKYVELYLASVGLGRGAPWCAAFVYYRLKEAAVGIKTPWPLQGFPRSGYCPDIEDWARNNHLWIDNNMENRQNIQRGDLGLFYFPAKGRVAHVGMITMVTPDGTANVEGNTSPGVGIQREGDGVYKKARLWAAYGAMGGFVRLPF